MSVRVEQESEGVLLPMTTTLETTWEWPLRSQQHMRDRAAAVLWDLAIHGDIIDPMGRAIEVLRERLSGRNPKYQLPSEPSYLLTQLERGGRFGACIERVASHGKCRAIRLLLPHDHLPECPWPEELPHDPAEPEAAEPEVEAPEAEQLIGQPEAPEPEPSGVGAPTSTPAPTVTDADTSIERLLLIQQLST
jgi:hypothetical protein